MSTGTDTSTASEVGSPRPRGADRRLVVVLGVLVLVSAVLVWWLLRGPSGRYAEAMDTLPEPTLRSSFTDWAAVGEEVDVPDLEEALDPDLVTRFLDRVYDRDLVTGSVQLDVIPALSTMFGYSLEQVDWEAYGQSRDGAVSVLRVTDEVDFEEVAGNLDKAGYDEPDAEDGVWRGTADLVSQFETPMTTLQIHVLLLADEGLILTSDTASYLEGVAEVIAGDAPSLREVPGVDGLIETAPEPLSAQLWARDFACEDLAMSQSDQADQDEAARMVEAVGGVTPLDGMLMARTGGQGATLAMWFDSEEDADHDLQARTDLARGSAPGQGGDFPERFTLTESRVEGQLITMRLRAETDTLMGDLGQGPVLFAAC